VDPPDCSPFSREGVHSDPYRIDGAAGRDSAFKPGLHRIPERLFVVDGRVVQNRDEIPDDAGGSSGRAISRLAVDMLKASGTLRTCK